MQRKLLKRIGIVLVLQFALLTSLFAQNTTVSGKITGGTGEALVGVTVMIKGTATAVASDADGNYTLSTPGNSSLVYTYIGFDSQEIQVSNRTVINVSMVANTTGLEEVVVVGYGTTKKASLTGSISTVKGDILQKSPSPNISNSLAGRLPGLVAITTTGEPGNDASMLRIRGSNTLGDNSPLIVVDGISNRSLDRIDPSTIESVTVLKDASAAIYGAQAANGVILITTKRGVSGNPSIQLNLNQGWNSQTVLPKMANSATYAQLINEIKQYAGQPVKYTAEDIQKYADGSDPWKYPNTDWFKETIKPWSPQRYGSLSLSGGAEKIKYFISVGSNFQDGMYKNGATNYSQANFRSNIDAKISDNIRLSFDISGRQENRNYSGVVGEQALDIFWAMNRAYPYLPAKWPNGLPGPDVEYGANPTVIVTDATGYDKDRRYIMESNMKLDITIPWVKGLSVTGNASIDKNFLNRKRFQKPWNLYSWDGESYDDNNEPLLVAGKRGFAEPRLRQWMNDGRKTTLNALINYERNFAKKHDFKVLVGTEKISGELMDFWAFRRYFTSTALDQMFAGGDLLKDNGGAASSNARLNYFGRLNYAYDLKYLVEFVWRYDGSYIFPESKRFGFFPGVSLGWRVSEENFWKENVAFVNDLKIRGSWGKTGNDRIEPYQFSTTYGYDDTYVFNQDVAEKTLRALRIPNPNITWEVANQSNIGFDAQLFDGKFSLSADYFNNLRTNILWWRNASVPASTGLSLPRENIGEVLNRGFELQLAYNNKVGEFSYQISTNGAYSKNQIKFWDETPGVPDYQQSTGNPMNARLYYKAIGVFVDQKEVDAYPHWAGARPGDIRFEDVNGDGKIDGLDRVRSSKTSIPTFTGGFNLDLRYKNFYTSVFFQGAAGAERSYRTFSGEAGNFLVNDIKNRWTTDNPSSTHPRTWNRSLEYWMTDGEPNNTYWVRSSDYLRLKNVEVGYNVPSKFSKKLGLENLRIYASGQNLLTFTGLKDFDPESPDDAPGSIWVNSQVYPLNKTLNLGLSLTL
ncbi:MAG: SusC/RagA family TonB-linked outer membrane protein [Sphingobacteriaceae bacterium]